MTSEYLVWYASHWRHLFPDPVPGLNSCPHRSTGPWLRVPSSTLSIFPRLGTSVVLCQEPGQKLMLPALSHQPIGVGGGSAPDLVPFHRAYFLVAQLPPGTSPISWVFILFCTPGAMPGVLHLGALGLRSYFALSITMETRALLPHHRSQSKVRLPHCKMLL